MDAATSQMIRAKACDAILDNLFHQTPTEEQQERSFAAVFESLSEIFLVLDAAHEPLQLDLVELVIEQYRTTKKNFQCYKNFTNYIEYLKNGKKSPTPDILEHEAFTLLHIVLKYGHLLEKKINFQCLAQAKNILQKNQHPVAKWGLGLSYFLHARAIGTPSREEEAIVVPKLLSKASSFMSEYLQTKEKKPQIVSETEVCPALLLSALSAAQGKDEDCLFYMTKARLHAIACPSNETILAIPEFAEIAKRQPDWKIILSEPRLYLKERLSFMRDRRNYIHGSQIVHERGVQASTLASSSLMSESTIMRDALSRSTLQVLQDQKFGLMVNLKTFFEPVKSLATIQAETRLKERMTLYGLQTRREIPGDGNCQMYSLSDQLTGNIRHAAFIRRTLVRWLRDHSTVVLPNGSTITDFVCDRKWEDWCAEMAQDTTWGDHLTLIAAAEVFCCHLLILSSIPGENFIIEICPTIGRDALTLQNSTIEAVPDKNLLMLSHFAEFHYGSMEPAL